MVFPCMVNGLALLTSQVRSMLISLDSTGSVNGIYTLCNQFTLSTTQVGSMVFTRMINELALSTAQVRSMVFTCMVNGLALSTAQVRSMVFPCMVN